jgi:hypothetical protein
LRPILAAWRSPVAGHRLGLGAIRHS